MNLQAGKLYKIKLNKNTYQVNFFTDKEFTEFSHSAFTNIVLFIWEKQNVEINNFVYTAYKVLIKDKFFFILSPEYEIIAQSLRIKTKDCEDHTIIFEKI